MERIDEFLTQYRRTVLLEQQGGIRRSTGYGWL